MADKSGSREIIRDCLIVIELAAGALPVARQRSRYSSRRVAAAPAGGRDSSVATTAPATCSPLATGRHVARP